VASGFTVICLFVLPLFQTIEPEQLGVSVVLSPLQIVDLVAEIVQVLTFCAESNVVQQIKIRLRHSIVIERKARFATVGSDVSVSIVSRFWFRKSYKRGKYRLNIFHIYKVGNKKLLFLNFQLIFA
jgi:hypothetical protein